MRRIFLDSKTIKKIAKNRDILEKELKVKIAEGKTFVDISGEGLTEYTSSQVIEAINLGFDIQISLLLKEEDYILQKIHIKDYIGKSSQRLNQVKARIIGKQGKAIQNISQLSNCAIQLHDSTVGIIGRAENIEKILNGVISLIRGSEHSNVYSKLEKISHEEEADLGLKEKMPQ